MSKHLTFHIVQPPRRRELARKPPHQSEYKTTPIPPASLLSPLLSASPLSLATSLSLSSFYDSLLALLHGDVPPNDREETAGQRHPDDAHGRGHARHVIPEVQFGEEEAERRGLHGRLDGHGAGFHLPEPGELGQPVTDDAPDEVEEEDGDLRTYARAGQLYYVFAKRKHEKEVKITANGGKSARGEKSRRIIQHAKKEGCGVGRPPLLPVMY